MILPNGTQMYLQTWDALADWLWILPKDALFIEELAILPVAGWLEKPIVEHVLQGLVKCAEDPLLGNPDGGIGIEPHALLGREERQKA